MKTLNLFLKMHFTSLSPDGQCISLAIVTEEYFNEEYQKYYTDKVEIKKGNCSIDHLTAKSFYAEFQDFDINRCDAWVKDNVISKLEFYPESHDKTDEYDMQHWDMCKNINGVNIKLTKWLTQFSDYKLNFIVDCGWFTWYKFVELMAEWNEFDYKANGIAYIDSVKTGLPKLPANFPPVPQDLNEVIAFKKGISVSEAFEVDRDGDILKEWSINVLMTGHYLENGTDPIRFNALSDAYVTKTIYEKLK